MEDFDSKLDRVLEANDGTKKELGDFREEVWEFRKETNFKFEVLTKEIKDIKLSFVQIKDYLSRIDEEIQDLKKILGKKADLERLEHLEREVAQIKLIVQKWPK